MLLGERKAGRKRHIDAEADLGLSELPVVKRLGDRCDKGAVGGGVKVVLVRRELRGSRCLLLLGTAAAQGQESEITQPYHMCYFAH